MSGKTRHTPKQKEKQGVDGGDFQKSAKQVRHTRLPGPKFRIFDPTQRQYVEHRAQRWPEADEIKWIENCLRERELLDNPALTADEKDYMGVAASLKKRGDPPSAEALRIWLGKVRDGLSWNELAKACRRDYTRHPEAARSYVIRAYNTVEKYLVGDKQVAP